MDIESRESGRASVPSGKPFTDEVVLITGAASGIGKATAQQFLECGWTVVGIDLRAEIESQFEGSPYLGIKCDIVCASQVEAVFQSIKNRWGRLDILVLNAGIVPKSEPIAQLSEEIWDQVLKVNLSSNLRFLRLAYPWLKGAPGGGRTIVVGSKTVAAPGAGQVAYSAAKAALTQVARVAALEWARDGIRVNVVNPDAVFDTGIFTEEVLRERANSYEISIEEYKRRNLMKTEITSVDVASLIVALCGPAFSKTTGARISVDGGNDRVI
jgi:NAD(P)-dependent dehydrogenase (short-subunit alcohol dehydrogenase family)